MTTKLAYKNFVETILPDDFFKYPRLTSTRSDSPFSIRESFPSKRTNSTSPTQIFTPPRLLNPDASLSLKSPHPQTSQNSYCTFRSEVFSGWSRLTGTLSSLFHSIFTTLPFVPSYSSYFPIVLFQFLLPRSLPPSQHTTPHPARSLQATVYTQL